MPEMTPRASKTIEQAKELAEKRGDEDGETDILRALLNIEGMASEILLSLGVDVKTLKVQLG